MQINKIIVDSTYSTTDLCNLGVKYPTDKSPYNKEAGLHKHAYTAVYDLLFSNSRWNSIKIGELGILDNNSMLSWREYFPNAELYGFEWFDDKLQKAVNDNIQNCKYSKMNIQDTESIEAGLSEYGPFDILIEDSTHIFEDQIRFINVAYKYLKPGGFLIIEDIFLRESEQRYSNELNHLAEYFSSVTFIEANHDLKYSPGWNNDKLLILYRNDKPC
jgi:demethylmacrocin O-methyltransferase